MAKNRNGYDRDRALDIEQPNNVIGGDHELRSLLAQEYAECQRAIKYFALDWDEYEDLLMVQSRTADNLHVRVSEGSLSTIVIERAGRVMAQMPSGVVNALGIKNTGQSLLYNLLLHNWIYPNANEQYDLETKLFLWDMYSNVYGTFGMMYDWAYREDYSGPDCWLIPMRNLWPQQGRFSTKNSDYMYVSTFMGRNDLQSIIDNKVKGYDLEVIQEVLKQTEHKGVVPASENDYLRHNPMWQYRRRANNTNTGQFEIVTKYEAGKDGRWISFFADYDNKVMRNIENPHKDGRIPVVLKYSLPTLDSIVGLGDMEKGRYMQYGLDTVLNLQIDYQKIHTYPPLKVIMQNVVMPSVRLQPGAKWGVSSMNDIGHHQLPEADQSHNMTFQFLQSAMSNVTGKTTTQVNGTNSSAQQPGKTPQAIRDQNKDESTHDAIDQKFMQKAIEELFGGMLNLINVHASDPDTEPIELDLFDDEIKQLMAAGYDDIKDIVKYRGKNKGEPLDKASSVSLKISPEQLKNQRGIRYKIDAGSTLSQDQEQQHEQLNEIMTTYVENAQGIEALLNAGGQTIDFPELFKQWFISGGLKQWNNILKPVAQGTQLGQQGASNQGAQQPAQQAQTPGESMNFKDMPASGQIQMAGQAGIQLTPQDVGIQQQMQPDMSQVMGQPGQQQVPQQAIPQQPQQPQAEQQQPTHGQPFIQDPEIRQAHAQIMGAMQ